MEVIDKHLMRETFGHMTSSSGLFQYWSMSVLIKVQSPSANSVKPVSLCCHTYNVTAALRSSAIRHLRPQHAHQVSSSGWLREADARGSGSAAATEEMGICSHLGGLQIWVLLTWLTNISVFNPELSVELALFTISADQNIMPKHVH